MSSDASSEHGPDLAQGVPIETLGEAGLLAGHVGNDAVMIARVGEEFLAVDAACTHYHGPLAEGLIVGDTVRCPWHHTDPSGPKIGPPGQPTRSPTAIW